MTLQEFYRQYYERVPNGSFSQIPMGMKSTH